MVEWLLESPVTAIVYLFCTIGCGLLCLKFAKVGFREMVRQAQTIQNDDARVFLILAKLSIVGGLLVFPGYITDLIAVCFWLMFSNRKLSDDSSPHRSSHSSHQHCNTTLETEGEWIDEKEESPANNSGDKLTRRD